MRSPSHRAERLFISLSNILDSFHKILSGIQLFFSEPLPSSLNDKAMSASERLPVTRAGRRRGVRGAERNERNGAGCAVSLRLYRFTRC